MRRQRLWVHENGSGARARGIICVFADQTRQDMEAERINTIGNLLADLGARTLDLRGYL